MIKHLLISLFIVTSLFLNAQVSNEICLKNALKIDDLVTKKSFEDAKKIILTSWKCEDLTESFYLNSEKVFNQEYNFALNKEQKNNSLTNLFKVYDLYDKKFIYNHNRNAIKKALLMFDNKFGTNKEVLTILTNKLNFNKQDFTNAKEINLYFKLLIHEGFKDNTNSSKISLFNNYLIIQELILQNILKTDLLLNNNELTPNSKKILNDEKTALEIVQKNINGYFAIYISCEDLIKIYNQDKDNNNNNKVWYQTITEKLFDKNCLENDLFFKIAQHSNDLNNSSKSNFYLANSFLNKNDYQKAQQYFDLAASLENNNIEKAKIYYTIATKVFGINNKQKSIEYLEKATATNIYFGEPYIFMVELYKNAESECFKTDFEKKAINFLIIDVLKKAEVANNFIERETKSLIEQAKSNLPNKASIKNEKMLGKSLKINCWINKTIEIPNK